VAAPAQPNIPEYILCDTGVVGLMQAAASNSAVLDHWPTAGLERLNRAVLAITIFTLGETREGHRRAGWGAKRVAQAEQSLSSYLLLPLDFDVLDRYVDVRSAYHSQIGDNDMWIAATAKARGWPLATCDTDFCILKDDLDLLYLPRRADSQQACP
jgi:tRNA(fMet)-specific endonuclease VapC